MVHDVRVEDQLYLPIEGRVVRAQDRENGVVEAHELVTTEADSRQLSDQRILPILGCCYEMLLDPRDV